MNQGVYSDMVRQLAGTELEDWAIAAARQADMLLANPGHGDYARWSAAIARLPEVGRQAELDSPIVALGSAAPDQDLLATQLMELHPWRKGPFLLAGQHIDTEWRSDWKWERLKKHVHLNGCKVLDIGCGNGYFGWRMLGAGAELVVGIDPTLVFVMQWLASRHFAPELPNYVLPMQLEDLPLDMQGWDAVFSMGVLYHRREREAHLARLRQLARPNGKVIIETLVIDGPEKTVLVPEGRYARMRNVWYIPSTAELKAALKRAGFEGVWLVDETVTSTDEQRSTDWMQFESLEECLDPRQPGKTIEGYPAPKRAIFVAH
jgi:tRNA (mo5U34)-methyltransferase